MYPADYGVERGPIVISWILVLYHRLMNSSSYDEQLSNQSFILLNEDLWKVLADALQSSIMVIFILILYLQVLRKLCNFFF